MKMVSWKGGNGGAVLAGVHAAEGGGVAEQEQCGYSSTRTTVAARWARCGAQRFQLFATEDGVASKFMDVASWQPTTRRLEVVSMPLAV